MIELQSFAVEDATGRSIGSVRQEADGRWRPMIPGQPTSPVYDRPGEATEAVRRAARMRGAGGYAARGSIAR